MSSQLATICERPTEPINFAWFRGTRLLKPTLFDVVGLRKGDCGMHVEAKRRRGAPRIFRDYGGLSRDEFYRRRYRAKIAATKQPKQPKEPKLTNSSAKGDIFVIESAPPGHRIVTTGFGIEPGERISKSNLDRIGGWSQTNGLLQDHDIQQSSGSNPSVFGFTDIDDESEWNDVRALRQKIAELRISYEFHPEILTLLEQPVQHLREILTVTNYKIANLEGHTGRRVSALGAGPDTDQGLESLVHGSYAEESDGSGNSFSDAHADEDSENSPESELTRKFFGEQTAVERGNYRCLICPTLKSGRKRETISARRDAAFEHFVKHEVRIRNAIAPFLPKKVKEWAQADRRVAAWDDTKVYQSFEWLDPRTPTEKAKEWLESRGIATTDQELVKIQKTEEVTRSC